MAPRTQRNFRLDDADHDAINHLAEILGGSTSEAVRQMTPPPGLAALVAYMLPAGHLGGRDYRGWWLNELAEHLCEKMERDREYPIARFFLPSMRDPEFTFVAYLDFLVAKDLAQGMNSAVQYEAVTGRKPDVWLARIPNSGIWRDREITSWAVLRRGQALGLDGVIEAQE